MNPQTGYKALKTLTVLFALNGVPGLLVSLMALGLYLTELFTGVVLLPHRGQQQATIGGLLVVLGMACFWAIEVAAAWLVWCRPSRLAVYLAVSITGIWAVCLAGITLEVLGARAAAPQLCILLGTGAVVCWPCIVAARWLSLGLVPAVGVTRIPEPSALPNGSLPAHPGDSTASEGPPSVS